MKEYKSKILYLTFFLLFTQLVNSQEVIPQTPYAEQKAQIFYNIFDNLVFMDQGGKDVYFIGLYGCEDDFVKELKKKKPAKIITGNEINIVDFDPNGEMTKYDIVIVGKSKNAELDNIYNKLLKAATENSISIALFTNEWSEKDKVTFNFVLDGSKEFVKFQYNKENLDKFNVSLGLGLKKLGGEDLNAQKLLQETKDELQKAEAELKNKEAELQKTIQELAEQQAKIDAQKSQIAEQQRLIEEKQLEIKKQQSNLQNLLYEMQIAKRKLSEQQQRFSQKELELEEKQQAIIEYENRINEMQDRYSLQEQIIEEKSAEIDSVNSQIEAKKQELTTLTNTVTLQRYALMVFALLTAVIIMLAFWIFRNYRKMKHQNILLEQQKNEIKAQAEELEKVNIELEKLSIVASKTNNAVAILDKNGNVDWINSGFTKLYGYTLQLLRNEQDININKMKLYAGINETLAQALSKKQSLYFEHQSITRENKILWIQTSITPILDYNNEIKQIVLVDSDISVIKEAEQKIAKQNKDIRNSIQYASRIQKATLPSTRVLLSYIPDSFILYLPRDIVSGDFYWSAKIKDKIFFAAADCTGHGVPGAFMSMLGITLLNEIVSNENYDKLRPDLILNELRTKLIHALSQSEEESSRDGIAIALCMLEKDKGKLHYAGAENEMIIVRNGVTKDYLADDMPIGAFAKPTGNFTNNIIDYQKGDMVYLFSDGYVDQFGGPGKRRKKFLIVRLRELFVKISNLPTGEQKDILLKTHLDWKGQNKQIDDILIMGVRL